MKHIIALVMLFCITSLSAQEFSMDLLKQMQPRNIGPGGMSGRVTAIDVVHSNPDIMYVGTASGGLWKSVSGGITWEPIFDNEVTASIGAVAIQQSNPSVVWVGTGEGNPRNSLNGGYGIYKSLDAGKTWTSMGLEKPGIFIGSLLILPIRRLFMSLPLDPPGVSIPNVAFIKRRMAARPGKMSSLQILRPGLPIWLWIQRTPISS